jgi:hypothetical protein
VEDSGRLPEEVACGERHPSGGERGRGRGGERAVGVGGRGRVTAAGRAGCEVDEETEADSHGAGIPRAGARRRGRRGKRGPTAAREISRGPSPGAAARGGDGMLGASARADGGWAETTEAKRCYWAGRSSGRELAIGTRMQCMT